MRTILRANAWSPVIAATAEQFVPWALQFFQKKTPLSRTRARGRKGRQRPRFPRHRRSLRNIWSPLEAPRRFKRPGPGYKLETFKWATGNFPLKFIQRPPTNAFPARLWDRMQA